MKRFAFLFLAAGLTLGMFCVAGCEPSDNGQRAGHDAQFSAGSGEFGTTPAIAGDYPNDTHHANAPTTDSSH